MEATQAPVALMFNVFVSSMNSAPEASVARKKTGICSRIRGDRRELGTSTRCPPLRRPLCIVVRLVPGN